jgi:hypothetical protein
MEISNRDKIIDALQSEIRNNQNKILSELKDLDIIRKDNRFLNGVYEDYRKYKDYIIKEKEREKYQMELLIQYLERILAESKLTDDMTRRAIFEQNRILMQLDDVKQELDNIITF